MAAAAQKRLEGSQRCGGDIVLDALGVGLRRLARRANGNQQIDDEPVALTHAFRHRGASLGQKYSAIGLRSREPLAFQAGDRLAGGGVGDAKPPRDIRCARFAIGRDQIGDQFSIVLERRGRARGARLAEAVGLRGLGRKFRGCRRRALAALPGDQTALAQPGAKHYQRRFNYAALAANCNLVFRETVASSLCAVLQPIDYDVAIGTFSSQGASEVGEKAMSEVVARTGMTDRTVAGIREALSGKMRWHSPLLFAGPAVIASIAYMDPGNFATNIQAGAKYGYALLWVVLVANVTAMLYQALSAKLGIVTGRNLAEMCREHFSQPVVWALWIVSEVAAMATDLAEFLGGAIGLSLLLHIPLVASMGVTAVLTYGLLMFEGRGLRPIELIIGSLVAAIALCYLAEMFIAPIDWGAAAFGSVVPQLADAGALTIAVGIVGATIMPHAIFLHSGLTQHRAPARNDDERRQLLRFSNIEVMIALTVAGLVNMAMVMMAASAFHEGHSDVAEIETAYSTLTPLLGAGAAS